MRNVDRAAGKERRAGVFERLLLLINVKQAGVSFFARLLVFENGQNDFFEEAASQHSEKLLVVRIRGKRTEDGSGTPKGSSLRLIGKLCRIDSFLRGFSCGGIRKGARTLRRIEVEHGIVLDA